MQNLAKTAILSPSSIQNVEAAQMKLSWETIQSRAVTFAKKWQEAHNEESEAQSFEREFMHLWRGRPHSHRSGLF